MKDEIAAAQHKLEQLSAQLEVVFKQIDSVAETMKNQGLARLGGEVDDALVQSHSDLTGMADRILDRMTELHRRIAGLRS